jgi:ABC-type hemin transport system substrate-binding protein
MTTARASNARAPALLAFLNARTTQAFAAADVEELLRLPRVADVLGRIVDLALVLGGTDSVVGVDELQTCCLQSRPASLSA